MARATQSKVAQTQTAKSDTRGNYNQRKVGTRTSPRTRTTVGPSYRAPTAKKRLGKDPRARPAKRAKTSTVPNVAASQTVATSQTVAQSMAQPAAAPAPYAPYPPDYRTQIPAPTGSEVIINARGDMLPRGNLRRIPKPSNYTPRVDLL